MLKYHTLYFLSIYNLHHVPTSIALKILCNIFYKHGIKIYTQAYLSCLFHSHCSRRVTPSTMILSITSIAWIWSRINAFSLSSRTWFPETSAAIEIDIMVTWTDGNQRSGIAWYPMQKAFYEIPLLWFGLRKIAIVLICDFGSETQSCKD